MRLLLISFLCVLHTIPSVMASEASPSSIGSDIPVHPRKNDEGWRWRDSLNFEFNHRGKKLKTTDCNFDVDLLHQELAKEESLISAELRDPNQNIVLAKVTFLISDFNGALKVVTVPLKSSGSSFSSESLPMVFRSGIRSKSKHVFSEDSQVHRRYCIEPPDDAVIKLMDHTTLLKKLREIEKSPVQLPALIHQVASTEKLLDESLHHVKELKDFTNERFVSDQSPSIVGDNARGRIKGDLAGKQKNKFEGLYLHAEQNLLRYLKKNTEKVSQEFFNFIRQFLFPSNDEVARRSQSQKPVTFGGVEAIVFHLHSKLDICDRCAPSIAREFEYRNSFLKKLMPKLNDLYLAEKSRILATIKELSLLVTDFTPKTPSFMFLASVREELKDKNRRFHYGHDGKLTEPINIEKFSRFGHFAVRALSGSQPNPGLLTEPGEVARKLPIVQSDEGTSSN